MGQSIEERASFDLIRYSNVWEDAEILCEALQPAPGKRFLSIASAGDNSFSLLASGADIVAVDLSGAQLACVELRRAAFRKLDHAGVLGFLGIRPSSNRKAVYQNELRAQLPQSASDYWDRLPDSIERGFIHSGKFENYFHKFRTRIVPLIHSKTRIAELLTEKPLDQRKAFYSRRWNTFRWRMLFRIFFSRFVMGRLGRDPEFFRYVKGSVSERILKRTEHALTQLETHNNPYLHYILTGNYGDALPHYLRAENFEAVREGLDRLTLHQGPIQEAAQKYGSDQFDGYNLSDLFEYLAPDLCQQIYQQLLQVARPHARFAYWNMLVPREVPGPLSDQVEQLTALADKLFQQDKAWFYSRFLVEEKK